MIFIFYTVTYINLHLLQNNVHIYMELIFLIRAIYIYVYTCTHIYSRVRLVQLVKHSYPDLWNKFYQLNFMQIGPPSSWKIIQTYDLAEECVRINYYGAKRTTEALIPFLQLSDSPRIVNVSSGAGTFTVNTIKPYSVYMFCIRVFFSSYFLR